MKLFLGFLLVGLTTFLNAQGTKSVLFIGNSYTYVNDLPSLVTQLATADGNTLVIDSYTPGGYQLNQHAVDPTTLSKIAAQSWDYVVIQEQSQKPSFPDQQVTNDVYPYAQILVDSIYSNDSCSIPLFYDTWGRKNGDPQWTGINTFEKMNMRLFNAYKTMSAAAKGMLSPVGIGYEHIKNDSNPTVQFSQLYQSDESHPTIFGSYLGACIFYNLIYATHAVGNSFVPAGLTANQAVYLQKVADHVVYEVDSVKVDYRPLSENLFTTNVSSSMVTFTSQIQNGQFVKWLFGDGNSSIDSNSNHDYNQPGQYTVMMITENSCYLDTIKKVITIGSSGLLNEQTNILRIYPNPSISGKIFIEGIDGKNFQIISLIGQEIYEGNQTTITLQKGIYFLKFRNTIKKIIIP